MAFEPYKAIDVDLLLGDDATANNFKCQARSVALTPDVNIERIKTLCKTNGSFASVDAPEWTLEIGYLYGRDTTDPSKALARFLLDHSGEQMPFTYRPWSGDDQEGYKGTVTIVPGGIGGEQGSFSEQTVNLPVEGQPEPLDGAGGGLAVTAAPAASDPMTAEVTADTDENVTATYGDESAPAATTDTTAQQSAEPATT